MPLDYLTNSAPPTFVFEFSLRYSDETEEQANRCRHIVIPGDRATGTYDIQSYEIQRPDLTGKPRWEPVQDRAPLVLMTDLFMRAATGTPGHRGVREEGAVRTIDLGTIIVPRP